MSVYDILGTVLSVIGLVGVVQQGYSWISVYLPAQQLKAFDETLAETSELFCSVVEEGLLLDPTKTDQIERSLVRLVA
jgi:hypothetical protein